MSLAIIDRLDLLEKLYGHILIAPAVRDEVIIAHQQQPDVQSIAAARWIETHAPGNSIVIALLLRELDRGEAEAIALALDCKAELLLLDERKARSVAAYLGLPVAGLIDILSQAKQAKLIPAIRPVLDDLMNRAKFRISRKLYQRVLENAGEIQDAQSA